MLRLMITINSHWLHELRDNYLDTHRRRGGVCIGPFRGADSVLTCEHIGKVTVRQIYEKGFRVIHMQDDKNTATYVTLVIEEQ